VPKFVADSVETTGLKWVAPAGGGANFTLLNTGGTALTGAQTITVSGISGADKIQIVVVNSSSNSGSSIISVRLNTDSGTNYTFAAGTVEGRSSYAAQMVDSDKSTSGTKINLGKMSTSATSRVDGYLLLSGCNSAGVKVFNGAGGADIGSAGTGNINYSIGGVYNSASTISSISIESSVGDFDNGTVFVYTSA
jgi:hypothetical protein